MTAVPTELLIEIFEYLFSNPTAHDYYDSLAKCARVCKSWAPVAQQILFRTVHDDGPLTFIEDERVSTGGNEYATPHRWKDLFIRSISENPTLASYVRSVAILEVHEHDVPKASYLNTAIEVNRQITLDQFMVILTCCPGIVELGVGFEQLALSPSTFSQLRSLKRDITTLIWTGSRDSEVLYQLLDVWPISILHERSGLGIRVPPPSYEHPLILQELVLEAGIDSVQGPPVLQWLLPPSRAGPDYPPLTLDISRYHRRDRVEVLRAYGPRIRCLIGRAADLDTVLHDETPMLETFILRSGLAFLPVTLPGHVKHLGLLPESMWRFEWDFLVLSYVTGAISANSHLLSFSVNTFVPEMYRTLLEETCKKGGVEFRVVPTDFHVHFNPQLNRRRHYSLAQ